jgi:hypothetical protein
LGPASRAKSLGLDQSIIIFIIIEGINIKNIIIFIIMNNILIKNIIICIIRIIIFIIINIPNKIINKFEKKQLLLLILIINL